MNMCSLRFIVEPMGLNSAHLMQYQRLADALMESSDSRFVHRLNSAKLIDLGAYLLCLEDVETGSIVSAMNVVVRDDVLLYQGLMTAQNRLGHGLAQKLVFAARAWFYQKFQMSAGYAEVRVMRDGEVNTGAATIFAKAGFIPEMLLVRRAADSPEALHLENTSDAAGCYSSLVMMARKDSIVRIVRESAQMQASQGGLRHVA